jgi:hypothetical protein
MEVRSSWNVMALGDAREGKWRGNWRMEWVTSTLHTTSEHGVSSITTVQLKCDGTWWRTGGEVEGKLANGVGSEYSSHYLGTWCIQHYYSPVEMWWHTVTHWRGSEGETVEWSGWPVLFTLPRNMVYPALLESSWNVMAHGEIGRATCRERVGSAV